MLVNEHHPVLKSSTIEVNPLRFGTDGLKELVEKMWRTMLDNNGIGLAAPQIGETDRIFVMSNNGERVVCINPEIVAVSESTVTDLEGCLSFPNLYLKVERPTQVTGKFFDENGNEIVKTFDGIMARCYSHELEHLQGVCFTTKVGPVALAMAQKRRTKQQRTRKK